MLRSVAIAYFALTTGLHAQTVFVNSHIVAQSSPPDIHFQISKDGTPPPFHQDPFTCVECDTEISFQYDGAKFKGTIILLDEQSDWFLVQPGDTFSAATINAGRFPIIFNAQPPQSGEVAVGPDEFYLGVRTGRGWETTPPYAPKRNAYGWMRLRPENGVLTMVENVMSYNSRGIIVGTTTVVPEPAALALIAVVALLATASRRRHAR